MNEIKYEIFDELEKMSIDVKKRRSELNSELSRVDKEITDIRHYIEFYPLSASKGYKMAKMMKDCLVRRRAIKDELEMLNRVSTMNIGFIGNGKGRDTINKLSDKHYKPRILKELFSD